jgi:hypothetical protein
MSDCSVASNVFSAIRRVVAAGVRWTPAVLALIASASILAAPSAASAQTLSLGDASGFEAFAVSNATTGAAGDFNFSNSTTDGSVALGANTYLGGAGTINGNLYADQSASYSGVNVMGSIITQGMGSYLSTLSQNVINTATAASGWNSSNANALTASVSGTNYQFTGGSGHNGDNVITVNSTTNSALLNLSSSGTSYTITINGTATEQFVFNITGHTTWTNVTVVLNGVNSSNVFFNFLSGNDGINSSAIAGNILNVINGTSMSIDNSTIDGSVMSTGFVDLANTVIAPEFPTVMMAGVASLIVLGRAGLKWRRGRVGKPTCPMA